MIIAICLMVACYLLTIKQDKKSSTLCRMMILQSARYIVSVVTLRLSVLHKTFNVLGSVISCAYNVSIMCSPPFEESTLASVILSSASVGMLLQNVICKWCITSLHIIYYSRQVNTVCQNYEHFMNFSTFWFSAFTKIYENLCKLIKIFRYIIHIITIIWSSTPSHKTCFF